MLRSFLPIGQGFFAVEHFQDVTIVFNCGGSKIKGVNEQTQKNLYQHRRINALFITDLQNNYTNGLEYLLKNYQVDNIIIPYLNYDERLYMLAKHLLYDKARNDILLTLLSKDKHFTNTNIIEIVGNSFFTLNDFCNRDDQNWIIYTCNYQYNECIKRFKKALSQYHLEDLTFDSLLKSSNKVLTTLRSLFTNDLEGVSNSNTLVVYSGPRFKKLTDYSFNYSERKYLKGGCLYVGDFNISSKKNYNELYNSFYRYQEFVGTITLPQHGSRHHYNNRLCIDYDARFLAFCSHKFTDRYPNKEVLRSIIYYNKPLYIIDESNHPFELIIGEE